MPVAAPRKSRLQIVYHDPGELKPHPGNANKHSARQVRQIADSIKQFGFTNPLLVDDKGLVLAGHGRLLAANNLGLTSVPIIKLSELSEVEKRAYLITDNRLAQTGGGWDRKLLAEELSFIVENQPDFDVELTGFDVGSIELILDQRDPAEAEEPDIVEPSGEAVTSLGDVWTLGRHRLLCGNALDRAAYRVLMGRKRARVAFLDPPYNLKISGFVSGRSRQRREFPMASGEMSEAEFTRFLTDALSLVAKATGDGAVSFVCMDWRHMFELLTAGRAAYDELLNICIWAKAQGGLGSLWRSQYEIVAVFKRGARPVRNRVELGRHGRNRTNLWSYPGANSFSATRATDLAAHPTVKPLAMVADALLDVSDRGDLVLDPFAGSGTTLLAAEQTGRRANVMELDPLYCDVIIDRFRNMTGVDAVDAAGEPFSKRKNQSDPRKGADREAQS